VRCEIFREALSAQIDSESGPLSEETLNRHVEGCTTCRSWREKSLVVRRSLVLGAAPPVPDLSEIILTNAPAPISEKWSLRIALGLVAIAQSCLSLAQLLGMDSGMHGDHGGMMEGHLLNESAAWNLAVGIGLLWAALRTEAAAGQLPLITGFVAVLTVVSADDLVGGNVTVARVVSHGFVVLGLVLLYAVYRQHRDLHKPSPVTGDALTTDGKITLRDRNSHWTSTHTPSGVETRRPTGRHHAA